MSKAQSQSQIIRFPNGCARLYAIASIGTPDGGVGCFDSQNNMIAFVPIADEAQKQRVAAMLTDCLDPSIPFKQPDWSFLNAKEKPAK